MEYGALCIYIYIGTNVSKEFAVSIFRILNASWTTLNMNETRPFEQPPNDAGSSLVGIFSIYV